MPYFPKNHVLFIHIPKTGGTSIEQGFLKDKGIQNLYLAISRARVICTVIMFPLEGFIFDENMNKSMND